jgi:hypothetical protein
VVVCDFAQLSPTRTVTVLPTTPVRGAARRIVTVFGRSYTDGTLDPYAPADVRVIVEQSDPAIGGDLGWQQVGSPVTLSAGIALLGFQSWSGTINFPGGISNGKYRIVVEERERMRDDGALAGATDPNGQPFPAAARRIIFSDIVDI